MTLKHFASKLTVKEITDDGDFEGYGSVFNEVDSAYDKVMPGAFRNTLQDRGAAGVKMLYQHDPSQPIGKWLEMHEDDHGLYVKGKILPKISKGAEVLEMIREKVVDGLSIGFRTVKSLWEEGTDHRQILEVDLWEISVVTFPANARARVDAVKSVRDAETILREGGVPANFAKLVAKYGFEEANRRVTKDRRDDGLQTVNINVADIFS